MSVVVAVKNSCIPSPQAKTLLTVVPITEPTVHQASIQLAANTAMLVQALSSGSAIAISGAQDAVNAATGSVSSAHINTIQNCVVAAGAAQIAVNQASMQLYANADQLAQAHSSGNVKAITAAQNSFTIVEAQLTANIDFLLANNNYATMTATQLAVTTTDALLASAEINLTQALTGGITADIEKAKNEVVTVSIQRQLATANAILEQSLAGGDTATIAISQAAVDSAMVNLKSWASLRDSAATNVSTSQLAVASVDGCQVGDLVSGDGNTAQHFKLTSSSTWSFSLYFSLHSILLFLCSRLVGIPEGTTVTAILDGTHLQLDRPVSVAAGAALTILAPLTTLALSVGTRLPGVESLGAHIDASTLPNGIPILALARKRDPAPTTTSSLPPITRLPSVNIELLKYFYSHTSMVF